MSADIKRWRLKMKKSLISVLVIGLLVFGLVLVGCDNGSTGGEEETGPKTLTKVEIMPMALIQ
jgi:hypothetical protein